MTDVLRQPGAEPTASACASASGFKRIALAAALPAIPSEALIGLKKTMSRCASAISDDGNGKERNYQRADCIECNPKNFCLEHITRDDIS